MKATLLAAGVFVAASAIAPTPVMAADVGIRIVLGGDRHYDNRYGYGGYGGYGNGYGSYGSYAYQAGYERGRSEGLKQGDRDDNRDRRYEYRDEKTYRNADKGYKREFGPRDAYQAGFRRGYVQGYDQGYRDRWGDRDYAQPRPGYSDRRW